MSSPWRVASTAAVGWKAMVRVRVGGGVAVKCRNTGSGLYWLDINREFFITAEDLQGIEGVFIY